MQANRLVGALVVVVAVAGLAACGSAQAGELAPEGSSSPRASAASSGTQAAESPAPKEPRPSVTNSDGELVNPATIISDERRAELTEVTRKYILSFPNVTVQDIDVSGDEGDASMVVADIREAGVDKTIWLQLVRRDGVMVVAKGGTLKDVG